MLDKPVISLLHAPLSGIERSGFSVASDGRRELFSDPVPKFNQIYVSYIFY